MMVSLLLAAVMAPLVATAARAPAPDRPNIIFCMTDDQGWGDTGYNGHPVLRTPHLDRMARESVRFDRFYSGAPVCSPTRGSVLTGRHPFRYGVFFANEGHLKPEEISLAELLKTQGYATGHFGKWHLGTLTTELKDSNRGQAGNTQDYAPPWENGFDECFSTEAKVPTWWHRGKYTEYGTRYWTGPGKPVPADEIHRDDSKLIMDRALPYIRSAVEKASPFFAVIWFHAPHLPVFSEPPYTDGYEDNKDYYGCLTAMDEQLGRLRKTLRELDVEANTMLWFTSDNGPEGGDEDPGRTKGLKGRKRSLYEGGIRVPGLLVWPTAFPEHKVIATPCSTSDYFPTVLDALGLSSETPHLRPMDGISLLPLLKGAKSERSTPIAFESRDQLALIDDRYKLYSADSGKSFELYDIATDPRETTNLAKQHANIVGRMQQTLSNWRESCRQSLAGNDFE